MVKRSKNICIDQKQLLEIMLDAHHIGNKEKNITGKDLVHYLAFRLNPFLKNMID